MADTLDTLDPMETLDSLFGDDELGDTQVGQAPPSSAEIVDAEYVVETVAESETLVHSLDPHKPPSVREYGISPLFATLKDCLYVDIETIPDWDREPLFGLPPIADEFVETPLAELLDPVEFVSQELKEAGEYLASRTPPEQWVAGCMAAERSGKKPRKGMTDLLEKCSKARMDALNAKSDRIKLLSLNPLYCQIAAICWAVGMNEVVSKFISTRDDERKALSEFWQATQQATPIVGFNVTAFDLPVIIARSMILGVQVPRIVSLGKYSNRDVLDLMTTLYPNGCPKGFGLKPTCRMLGIPVPEDHGDGGQVWELWSTKQFNKLSEYCTGDVRLTRSLHREKMSGYFCI